MYSNIKGGRLGADPCSYVVCQPDRRKQNLPKMSRKWLGLLLWEVVTCGAI